MNKTDASRWHHRDVNSLLAEFDSDLGLGLSPQEAENRISLWGLNRLQGMRSRYNWQRFFSQFHNLLIYVLLGAALITGLLDHWTDTGVILAVVLINALIGYIQEGKAEKAIAAVQGMLAPKAVVKRGGLSILVDAAQLVPGDLVLLKAGDKVPADLRILQSQSLQIDEAILTGESLAVNKKTQVCAENTLLAERHNMAYSGTLVTAGQGLGLVVATGEATEIGRISAMLAGVETLVTPLLRKMAVFARRLTVCILSLAALLFVIGHYAHGYSLEFMLVAVVGIAVAAIPEGLPIILTVTLAIGVERMARRHALIRRLPAVETLGSVSVICSDKTGTLTRNELSVQIVALPGHHLQVEGVGYQGEGGFLAEAKPIDPKQDRDLQFFSQAAVLCSEGSLRFEQGEWLAQGNPVELALLSLAAKAGIEPQSLRQTISVVDLIPFDSRHKWMASLRSDGHIYIKGAPEEIFKRCQQVRHQGECQPFALDVWHHQVHALAGRGLRTLALAYKPHQGAALSPADVDGDLIFLGLVGIIDPPRPEAIAAIRACYEAQISVKMITGDHAGTARALGQQLGIRQVDKILTGHDLQQLTDADLLAELATVNIFARTTPEDKLRLVSLLQQQGHVVAMTGDGVNDAPALKRADVGVAMGLKGTEVAREAAEMVISDDNFASIVAAVQEGRTVYDNLKKAIMFLLPINGGEVLSLVVALLFGLLLPITPVQILWVNMVSSVALSMSLAFEPAEPGIMQRRPTPLGESLLSRQLVWRIGFISLVFLAGIFGVFKWGLWAGYDLETARTMAVNMLVLLEVMYLFSSRYIHGPSLTWAGLHGTRAIMWAIALVTLLQSAFTFLPPMQRLFSTAALDWKASAMILGLGLLGFLLMEVEKLR